MANNIFPPYDQRGVSRPQLTFADAGAFELNPNELFILGQPQSMPTCQWAAMRFSA